MGEFMRRYHVTWCLPLCLFACADGVGETTQAFMQNQGTQLHGIQLQGTPLQSMTMQGFQFAGATLNGAALNNLHLEHSELVAEQDQATLRGTALAHAHVFAQVHNINVNPPTTATVEYE